MFARAAIGLFVLGTVLGGGGTAHACDTWAAETLGNDLDDDCDGLTDAIRRDFTDGRFVLGNAQWDYGVSWGPQGDTSRLGVNGAIDNWMRVKDDVPWESGSPHFGIEVSSLDSGVSCYLRLDSSAGSPYLHPDPLVLGYNEIEGSRTDLGDPPYDLTFVQIECYGATGYAEIDWVTIANGSYEWAPNTDQTVTYDDAAFPGGGQATVVLRAGPNGDCWAGSDLGGLAWAADCEAWDTRNGKWNDLLDHAELGVWDVFAHPMTGDALIATGRSYSGGSQTEGGLFYTANRGLDWQDQPVTPAGSFATVGTLDHCQLSAGVSAPSRRGGKLLARSGLTGGGEQFFAANHKEGFRDVYVVPAMGTTAFGGVFRDAATLQTFQAMDEFVSALEVVEWSQDTSTLFVGFKTSKLYRCDLPTTALTSSSVVDCDDISAGLDLDVRDLEYVPLLGTLFVVDGGRRFDGASTCTLEEGDVLGVTVTSGSSSPAWTLDGAVGDTTRTCPDTGASINKPAWDDPVYDFRCFVHNGVGRLRTVHGTDEFGAGELTGLAIDDAASRAVVFQDANARTPYAKPKVFHADLPGSLASPTTLSWSPYQDFQTGDQWEDGTDPYNPVTNKGQRSLVVSGRGTWLDDQQILAGWYPALPIDGIFIEGELGDDLLVSSGYGLYRLDHSGAGALGWDSDYTVDDLDSLPWAFAQPPPGSLSEDQSRFDFGLTVAKSTFFCPNCDDPNGYSADGFGVSAVADLGIAHFYGPESLLVKQRSQATVDCHFQAWEGGGFAVSGVDLEDGTMASWMAVGPQGTDGVSLVTGQALFRREADGYWGWEGTRGSIASTQPRSNYLTSDRELMCLWGPGGETPYVNTVAASYKWPVCNADLDPGLWGTQLSGLGVPRWLATWSDEATVAAFRSTWVNSTTLATDGGGGLAILHTDTAVSPEVTTLDLIPDLVVSGGDGRGACTGVTQDELFQNGPRIELDPNASWYTDPDNYELRVHLTFWGTADETGSGAGDTDACRVWEVVDARTSGTRSTSWTSIDLSAGAECPLSADMVDGLQVARWAPDTVFVFGGKTGQGGICALPAASNADPTDDLPVLVMDPASWDLKVRHVAPHPHLARTLLVGTKWELDDTNTNIPGVFMTNLRYDVRTLEWKWVTARDRSDTLANPVVEHLSWAAYPDYTTEFYLGVNGSGVLMGSTGW